MARFGLVLGLVGTGAALAGQASPSAGEGKGPQANTVVLDADGTARVTRVVPVPGTVSAEAQTLLRWRVPEDGGTLEARRKGTDAWQTRAGRESRAAYPVEVRETAIAAVPVHDVLPVTGAMRHPEWVLINVHGGGFEVDSGSYTESVPMANLTGARVVAVLYRMAPEHPFPAAVEDTVAVYRELLKTYKPAHIALYGTSAGAILTGEVAVRLKQLGLPLPAALGIFSGMGDFARTGDSQAMYGLWGLSGTTAMPSREQHNGTYVGATDPKDPVLSPVYADLHGMPPTLLMTSTRDLLLSGTTILHRALLRDGVDASLVVFEALPHAFWNNLSLPETKEAYGLMAGFFVRELGRRH